VSRAAWHTYTRAVPGLFTLRSAVQELSLRRRRRRRFVM